MKKTIIILLGILLLASCSNNKNIEIELDSVDANMLMYTDLLKEEKIGKFLKMDGKLLTEKFEDKDSFIIFVGHPNCSWCQKGISVVNEFILNNNIFIYYLNPKFETIDTIDYLNNKCLEILTKQSEEALKLPSMIAVKDGIVVSVVSGGVDSQDDSYTEEERKQLLNRYQEMLKNISTDTIRYDSSLIPNREINDLTVNHDQAIDFNIDTFETYRTYGSGNTFIANQDGLYILYRTLLKDSKIGYYSRYIDEYILQIDEKNIETFKANKDNINKLLIDIYNQTYPDTKANEDFFNSLNCELLENSDGSADLYVEIQYVIDYLRLYDNSYSQLSTLEMVQDIVDKHDFEEYCDDDNCIYYSTQSGEYCYPEEYFCLLVDSTGEPRKYYFDYSPYELVIQMTDYNWELYETNN